MKITYLVPNIDGMGGTSRAVLTQAHALRERHEIEILSVFRSAGRPHYDVPEGVAVRYLSSSRPDERPSTSPNSLQGHDVAPDLVDRPSVLVPQAWDPTLSSLADPGLEDALPAVRGDILITVTPGLLAAAAQLAPASVALVHQEHRASSERTAGLEPLLAFGPRADAIVLLTHDVAEWLGTALGDTSPPLDVIPNALPPGYRPTSMLSNPLIVSAGRFVKEKQFTQLIRAFGQIADRIPDWRLRIYGSGPHQARMTRVIRKTRLFDRVELPGTSETMATNWANASVAALTSRSEGLPLIVQEAMAAGVPVASYDCPSGPRALIEHEKTGLLVPSGSEAGMAEALLTLATDHQLRRDMGAAARASTAQYEPTRIATLWEELFARVLHARSRVDELPRATGRALAGVLATEQTGSAPATHPEAAATPSLTPQEARSEAMQAFTSTAAEVVSDWFVLPGNDSTPTVVIPHVARRQFLETLARKPLEDFWLCRPESTSWPEKRGSVSVMAEEMIRTAAEAARLEPRSGPEGEPGLLSRGCGVAVEFWTARDDRLWPGRESAFNKPVRRVESRVDRVVHGVQVPTLACLGDLSVHECEFPVDAVVTWVDGSDEHWAEQRRRRLHGMTGEPQDRTSVGRARYADNGELRYTLRSMDLFAPWIRRIHVVTAGQVPQWLDTSHPKIHLVDHSEILPDEALPTFNSHAIETSLHRIPGLSEHYLYFNDDVLLATPASKETFFTADGRPAMFPSMEWIGPDDPDAPAYLQAAYNNRRLLERDFGRTITHTLAHAPHPQSRTLVAEVVDRYEQDVARTARAAFRSPEDVSVTSSLAQHYGIITGKAWRGTIQHKLVNRTSARLKAELSVLSRRELDTFCIADNHDHGVPKEKADAIMTAFFEDYFPHRSAWEIG